MSHCLSGATACLLTTGALLSACGAPCTQRQAVLGAQRINSTQPHPPIGERYHTFLRGGPSSGVMINTWFAPRGAWGWSARPSGSFERPQDDAPPQEAGGTWEWTGCDEVTVRPEGGGHVRVNVSKDGARIRFLSHPFGGGTPLEFDNVEFSARRASELLTGK